MTPDWARETERPAPAKVSRGEKLPEIVARQILRDIVEREMAVGDRLPPEAVMAEGFEVGRGSVREGLRILESHGLVKMKPGPQGGPVVTEATYEDFGRVMSLFLYRSGSRYSDLLEARLAIEPTIARWAAERMTPDGEERLRAVLAGAAAETGASSQVFARVAEEFHSCLATLTGNNALALCAGALIGIEGRHIGSAFPPDDRHLVLQVHEAIAAAVFDHDADKAEDLTRRHIAQVVEYMRKHRQGQLGERVIWK